MVDPMVLAVLLVAIVLFNAAIAAVLAEWIDARMDRLEKLLKGGRK